MIAVLNPCGASPGVPLHPMTFRIYVRWPGQRVSDKTTTDSRTVAEVAFNELAAKAEQLGQLGAIGIAFSEGQKSIQYRNLTGQPAGVPPEGGQ